MVKIPTSGQSQCHGVGYHAEGWVMGPADWLPQAGGEEEQSPLPPPPQKEREKKSTRKHEEQTEVIRQNHP